MICGTWLTIAYAPPWTMAKADQNIQALIFLQKTLPKNLTKYWSDYKTPPQKLDDMAIWKTVPPDIKNKITYTFHDSKKCTACALLDVDPITARRLRIKTDLSDNLTGKVCESFNFLIDKNEISSMVVKIISAVPDQTSHLSTSTPPKD